MADIYEIAQGDLEPTMLIDLTANGVAQDVSDATGAITMRWLKPDGTFAEGVALTNVDLVHGSVSKPWASGDTDVAGCHRAQVVVPRPGGPQSFPTDGSWFRWYVSPKLTTPGT